MLEEPTSLRIDDPDVRALFNAQHVDAPGMPRSRIRRTLSAAVRRFYPRCSI